MTPNVHGDTTDIESYSNIPGGLKMSFDAYPLHRMAEVFSKPENWSPERWLTVGRKKLEQVRRGFSAFGAGRRMCFGIKFATKG